MVEAVGICVTHKLMCSMYSSIIDKESKHISQLSSHIRTFEYLGRSETHQLRWDKGENSNIYIDHIQHIYITKTVEGVWMCY